MAGEEELNAPCRVVTWNLWWRFGDWARRLDVIGGVLQEVAPDVVGLQEVWATPDANAAALLASRLGLHWTWVPSPAPQRWQERLGDDTVPREDVVTPSGRAGTRVGHHDTLMGNAVLSRWPIVGAAHVDLPAPGGRPDGRTVLHAVLDTPRGGLPFFTTQLSAFPGRSALRVAQVRQVAGFVAARSSGDGLPPVVTGDLNAVPEADEVRLLSHVSG